MTDTLRSAKRCRWCGSLIGFQAGGAWEVVRASDGGFVPTRPHRCLSDSRGRRWQRVSGAAA